MKKYTFVFLIFIPFLVYSQKEAVKKELTAKRIQKAPKIDGLLDDEVWKTAAIAKDFVMLRPDAGKQEPQNLKTEVKIVYDDEAIYVGAYMYDDHPENILREFKTRDNFGNADFFAVTINPTNDGINQFEFFLTSAGNQNDAVVSANGEDYSWNAIWESGVKIVSDGWIAEFKIPYAALRFSNEKEQIWGINFHRKLKKANEQYVWNPVDVTIGSVAQYDGILKGISNIKPPLRLSFYPFISGMVTNYQQKTDFDWTGGLDLKYGINESFTLDATLIPDFGQVAFDDVTLNLGPFEQIYSEKRAFFTEGTDLFSKGNLFNSRRIGASPINKYTIYDDLNDNETIVDNPDKVKVLNIIKVSGRTKKGLGIGVLNAITDKTEALIKDESTHQTRKITTAPLANYNVFVLDQQFNKNSSISLVNTNVLRNGNTQDANVTSLLYDINKKDNSYGVSGGFSFSNIFKRESTITGKQTNIHLGKLSGKNRFGIGARIMDDKYNKNDLGYQRRNNYMSFSANYSYRQFKPKGKFNNYSIYSYASIGYLFKLDESSPFYEHKKNKFTGNHLSVGFWGTTKKQWNVSANFNSGFGTDYDYYEPRVSGRFYASSPSFNSNFNLSSDYSKKFSFHSYLFAGFAHKEKNKWIGGGVTPRYRFNDNFSISYSVDYDIDNDELGFADFDDDDNSIFGNRDSNTLENAISGKYNFSTKASLGLSVRHFWTQINYDEEYFVLKTDGTLTNSNYSGNNNANFNTWNFDLKFNWEFAKGSQFVILYRNNIYKDDELSRIKFGENLNNLFKEDLFQNLSVKLIYYIDYNWF